MANELIRRVDFNELAKLFDQDPNDSRPGLFLKVLYRSCCATSITDRRQFTTVNTTFPSEYNTGLIDATYTYFANRNGEPVDNIASEFSDYISFLITNIAGRKVSDSKTKEIRDIYDSIRSRTVGMMGSKEEFIAAIIDKLFKNIDKKTEPLIFNNRLQLAFNFSSNIRNIITNIANEFCGVKDKIQLRVQNLFHDIFNELNTKIGKNNCNASTIQNIILSNDKIFTPLLINILQNAGLDDILKDLTGARTFAAMIREGARENRLISRIGTQVEHASESGISRGINTFGPQLITDATRGARIGARSGVAQGFDDNIDDVTRRVGASAAIGAAVGANVGAQTGVDRAVRGHIGGAASNNRITILERIDIPLLVEPSNPITTNNKRFTYKIAQEVLLTTLLHPERIVNYVVPDVSTDFFDLSITDGPKIKRYERNGDLIYDDGVKSFAMNESNQNFTNYIKERAQFYKDNSGNECGILGFTSDKQTCDKFLLECLAGNNISQCKEFMSKKDYWSNMKVEIDNIIPDHALSILRVFQFKEVRNSENLREIEKVDNWLGRLNNLGPNNELSKEEINAIRNNDRLCTYLRLLINKINKNPTILNPKIVTKRESNRKKHTLPKKDLTNIRGGDILNAFINNNLSGGASAFLNDSSDTYSFIKNVSLGRVNVECNSDILRKGIVDLIDKLGEKGRPIHEADTTRLMDMIDIHKKIEEKLGTLLIALKRYIENYEFDDPSFSNQNTYETNIQTILEFSEKHTKLRNKKSNVQAELLDIITRLKSLNV